MKKFSLFSGMLLVLLMVTGCNSTFMPTADPNRSDLTADQANKLAVKKFHVPCRVEVHCSNDSMVGLRDSAFFTNYYHYPLHQILNDSFKSAVYQVFDQPGAEVVDAFCITVTVPESNLDVAWGKANYMLQVIVRVDEPGEKKVMAISVEKHLQLPFPKENEIPEAVYQACRDVAYEALAKIIKDPKVHKTVRRFESR